MSSPASLHLLYILPAPFYPVFIRPSLICKPVPLSVFAMDGIFLIVLAGFAGLCAVLLKLCAVLAPRAAQNAAPQGAVPDVSSQRGASIGGGQ